MPRPPSHQLTANEWHVMQIVWRLRKCAAREVYEVAGREHGWAPTTVKTYLRNTMRKLSARNRVETVHLARSASLLN